MITKVTLTGADDSTPIEQLIKLAAKYPFVEWGILVSRKSAGRNRFPTKRWLDQLVAANNQLILTGKGSLNLSLHLCGSYVHELLAGDGDFIETDLSEIWDAFSRVQINTHGEKHYISTPFPALLNEHPNKEFIFQYDNVNAAGLEMAIADHVKCSALFDLSHGAGILPDQWPVLLDNVKCGYAGGLSPENVESQITAINHVVGDTPIWIDMETHLRSFNDKIFDLGKCVQVLQICSDYVNQQQIPL